MSAGTTPTATERRWDHHRTDRLVLDHVHDDDIEEWHTIHADPEVWTHFPSGRHHSRDVTAEFVHACKEDWSLRGLGYWSIRTEQSGRIIGCGGCRLVPELDRWNLYDRFAPAGPGYGYASEVARTAVAAANDVDPARPVVAYMLEQNVASSRVAERIGLVRVWAGPDEGNPDPNAVGYLYADRPEIAP